MSASAQVTDNNLIVGETHSKLKPINDYLCISLWVLSIGLIFHQFSIFFTSLLCFCYSVLRNFDSSLSIHVWLLARFFPDKKKGPD